MSTTVSAPDTNLFRSGNTKLSGGTKAVWGFGLPSRHTCPAKTETCSSRCYSYKLEQFRKHVGAAHRANLQLAKREDFTSLAVAEIRRKKIRVLRVHVGGELFSVGYAEKWLAVFKQCPDVKFFLWTRVWRLSRFRPVLREMAARTNVRLWFSCDRDTGVPRNYPDRVRLAYMQVAEDDLPPKGDLVFRTHHLRKEPARTVKAARPGERRVTICPTETGLPGHEEVTCSSCQACFKALPGDGVKGRVALSLAS